MATKPEIQQAPATASEQVRPVPGVHPNTIVRNSGEVDRYGQPVAKADSPRAMMDALKQEILAEIRGEDGAKAEAAALKASRKRNEDERAARQERINKRIESAARYKAKGDPTRPAGEIELPDRRMGRMMVMGGEEFSFAGVPSPSWMEPLDDVAAERIENELDRRERIRRAAEENSITRDMLDRASKALDAVTVANSRDAAGVPTRDRVAGAGG